MIKTKEEEQAELYAVIAAGMFLIGMIIQVINIIVLVSHYVSHNYQS